MHKIYCVNKTDLELFEIVILPLRNAAFMLDKATHSLDQGLYWMYRDEIGNDHI